MDDVRMATMAEATRLTGQGRLTEATTLIQRNLGIAPPARGRVLALQPLRSPGPRRGAREADQGSPG
ncbi:MAG TPA: esterase, partial [Acidimicrobiia bacterium]|nr:esterase [Acidimicrobiia bacterium]